MLLVVVVYSVAGGLVVGAVVEVILHFSEVALTLLVAVLKAEIWSTINSKAIVVES